MLMNSVKLTGALFTLNYAYKNYFENFQGISVTISKIAHNVLNAPSHFLSKAQDCFASTRVCTDAVANAQATNLDQSWYNPLKYFSTLTKGINHIGCKIDDVVGTCYLGISLGAAAGIGFMGYKTAAPLVKLLGSTLTGLVKSKPKQPEAPKACFQEQIKEFAKIFTKLNQKVPSMLSTVVLKGDVPVVELKTDLSKEKLLEILKNENINIKSLEISPEGKCLKIHLATQTSLDFSFVL